MHRELGHGALGRVQWTLGSEGRRPAGTAQGLQAGSNRHASDGSSPWVGYSGHRAWDHRQSLQAGCKGLKALGRGCRHWAAVLQAWACGQRSAGSRQSCRQGADKQL